MTMLIFRLIPAALQNGRGPVIMSEIFNQQHNQISQNLKVKKINNFLSTMSEGDTNKYESCGLVIESCLIL